MNFCKNCKYRGLRSYKLDYCKIMGYTTEDPLDGLTYEYFSCYSLRFDEEGKPKECHQYKPNKRTRLKKYLGIYIP